MKNNNYYKIYEDYIFTLNFTVDPCVSLSCALSHDSPLGTTTASRYVVPKT